MEQLHADLPCAVSVPNAINAVSASLAGVLCSPQPIILV